MSTRRKVTRVIVFYENNGLQSSITIPIVNHACKSSYSGLFWDDLAVMNLLSGYYDENSVSATSEVCEELGRCNVYKNIGQVITREDVDILWNYESGERVLPFMIAKKTESPFKIYY